MVEVEKITKKWHSSRKAVQQLNQAVAMRGANEAILGQSWYKLW